LGALGFVFQVLGQLPQKRFYPNPALYGFAAQPVNAGTALVGPAKPPGVGESLGPAARVVERLKAIGRLLLGLGVELPL